MVAGRCKTAITAHLQSYTFVQMVASGGTTPHYESVRIRTSSGRWTSTFIGPSLSSNLICSDIYTQSSADSHADEEILL